MAPVWANSASLAEIGTGFADMLNEEMRGGRYKLFDYAYRRHALELPWKGMWWRRVLESGKFAKVFAVESNGTVPECPEVEWALKVSKSNDTDWFALKDACVARALASMPDQAPAVLPVFDVRSNQGHVFVMSRRAKIDLFEWERHCSNRLTSRLKKPWADPTFIALKVILFHQVLDGIQRMHALGNGNGVVHCDISPENVMVRTDNYQAFLIDFDAARRVGNTIRMRAGKLDFMSPQYIEGKVCGRDTDIWAAGVTLYLLLIGDFPYTSGELANDDPALKRIPSKTWAAQLLAAEQFAARMKTDATWQGGLRGRLDKMFTDFDAPDKRLRETYLQGFVGFPVAVFRMLRSLFDVNATHRVEDFGNVVIDAARLANVSAGLVNLTWPVSASAGAAAWAGGDVAQCAKAVQKMAKGEPHPVVQNIAGLEGLHRCLEDGDT
uniref:Protein kinase domain-containing protein n=1 Tax=Zooxanthella nutricula TaxID=1333877 RepID=A0A6U8UKG1_9DINO